MNIGITTSVTKKGQVTIPASIRKALGIDDKTKVEFVVKEETITLKPVKGIIASRVGVIRPKKKPEDFKLLREKFEEGVAEEVLSEF